MKSAIGAKIKIVCGSDSQIREVNNQSSYLSQNSLIQHFGIAKYTSIDTLTVQWPSGVFHKFVNIPANQKLEITEKSYTIKKFLRPS